LGTSTLHPTDLASGRAQSNLFLREGEEEGEGEGEEEKIYREKERSGEQSEWRGV
jgi:hypothetical protein